MRRIYAMSLLFILMLTVFPQLTSAHTKLQTSSPEPNATVVEEIKEVVLEFNTEVEPLSSFKIKMEDGTELKVGNKEIKDHRIVGTFDEGIPNGVYTVEWKIVGKDGHPIKGDFSFTVDVPVDRAASESTKPTAENSPAPTELSPTPTTEPSQAQEDQTSLGDTAQESNKAGLWIAAGVVIVALIVIIFVAKRKK